MRVYLLGQVGFQQALALQHRLVDEVAEGSAPALLCCEHSPVITVGRSGSHAHMELEPLDLAHRAWPVRWINRGGGCWLQTPGQLALCPILPLQRLQISLGDYLRKLQTSLILFLRELGVAPEGVGPDICVAGRPIACTGAAVRDWITYFGAIVNVNPDLLPFRHVRTGHRHAPMTSLQRECRRPFRPGYVRDRLLEHFIAQFGLGETLFFSNHPSLGRKAWADVVTTAP